MKKIKILLCGPPLEAIGGGPTHMRNMMASALKDRYEIAHFTSGSRGTESPAKNEPIRDAIVRVLFSPLVLAWRIVRARPEIIHLNTALDQKAFWRDLVYLLVGKLLGRKVIVQVHGGSIESLTASRSMHRVVRTFFSLPDAVVVLANSEIADFRRLGIVTRRLARIPNGVNVWEYREPNERRHSGAVRRLGYIGRLLNTKGIVESIRAVAMLREAEAFRSITFDIAGSGPAQPELTQLITELGLEDRVTLRGPLFGEEKVDFLRAADVFLFPSYHAEGLPYCILESLAAGTPVIASRTAGIPDVVQHGVHGILVNVRDPEAIARAVEQLAESEDLLRAMSNNCMEWAGRELSLERLAMRFTELYEIVRNDAPWANDALSATAGNQQVRK